MDNTLTQLADSTSKADSLESLTRPLLSLLNNLTGLESTYLTMVDEVNGLQHILFSNNDSDMQIPEGLAVPWHDTLCKRAMDENRPYTDDVSTCWGDSAAARELGIKTYVSQPVRRLNGALYGTLCGASTDSRPLPPGALSVLNMFAQLIAHQIEREQLLANLRQSNSELMSRAMTDALTGVANRHALEDELARTLQQADRNSQTVQLAFIDLDGFKQVNDEFGHDAGDRLLIHVSEQLLRAVRRSDLVARFGGDEFVVLSPGGERDQLEQRLSNKVSPEFEYEGRTLRFGGASVGVVTWTPGDPVDADALLGRADQQMYEAKKRRKG